jgi:tetratricopeptide (TPR) repeat protein
MRIAVVFAAASILALGPLELAQSAKAQGTSPIAQPGAKATLAEADKALQAGEADRALGLLASTPAGVEERAEAGNLRCRVRMTLEQWDAAVAACEQAVQLDGQNSNYHLWLGRALGRKAAQASFLNAYGLAKRARAEFEEAVRLNPRNVEALSDVGNFYQQAPGVVGGGIDKAQAIAEQLDKIDAARGHQLRALIAEAQKDYPAAERRHRLAIAAAAHPAEQWINLAMFYERRKQYPEMEAAIRDAMEAAGRDQHAAVAFYDGAGILIETRRNQDLAVHLLEQYLSSANHTEEGPVFIAHLRLARLKERVGDTGSASRERAAAMAMAHDFKPTDEAMMGESLGSMEVARRLGGEGLRS